jgi:uncharacterized protein YndB with AHSA1/START domain
MTAHAGNSTEVRTSVDVTVAPEVAFDVFTTGIDRWWNRGHHLLSGELKEVGVEPRSGGRLWEENEAGEICTWGRVLTWDPPRTFAFSWLISVDFSVPTPDAVGSRVTVTFTPTASGTQVTLVHDQFENHGPGWENMRDGVGSEGGWPSGIRRYAEVAETSQS